MHLLCINGALRICRPKDLLSTARHAACAEPDEGASHRPGVALDGTPIVIEHNVARVRRTVEAARTAAQVLCGRRHPQVAPARRDMPAYGGQVVDIPDCVVCTAASSVRAAIVAVNGLLGIDKDML